MMAAAIALLMAVAGLDRDEDAFRDHHPMFDYLALIENSEDINGDSPPSTGLKSTLDKGLHSHETAAVTTPMGSANDANTRPALQAIPRLPVEQARATQCLSPPGSCPMEANGSMDVERLRARVRDGYMLLSSGEVCLCGRVQHVCSSDDLASPPVNLPPTL